MLELGGVTAGNGRNQTTSEQLAKLWRSLEEMVLAQGGDLEDLYRQSSGKEQVPVYAEADGCIAALH